MIKKTYVRVITLLLVALMILGVMAPAFTSYAASELLVISGTTRCFSQPVLRTKVSLQKELTIFRL